MPATDPITAAILGYGLPGIMVAVLLMALKYIFGLYCASQEARIVEGRETVKAMERNTDATERLIAVLQERKQG